MNKAFKRITAIILVLVAVLAFFQVRAFADDNTFYMFVGDQGTMSITSNQVPNAKWKTSKPSVLSIVKQSPSSVTTKGKKAGISKLTVYNSKKTSQKYTYTIKVVKKNKLIKSDFTVKGSQIKSYVGASPYNLMNYSQKFLFAAFDVRATDLNASNSSEYMETYRGIHIYDPYSKVCERYGKKALKNTTKKDPFYKENTSSQYDAARIKSFKRTWNKQFKYYTDYALNSTWKMRMYFNGNKKLVGVVYGNGFYK